MFKNISNTKLLLLLAVLAAVYAASLFFGGKEKSKGLKTELVSIDAGKTTKLRIEKKAGHPLELFKEGSQWKVSLADGKIAVAMNSKVEAAISQLESIRPSRLASRNESKWKNYEVDSAGTRIKVFEGNKNTLDIVLGRLAFGKQAMGGGPGMGASPQFHTFVRLASDAEVYAADNFMGMTIPTEAKNYRDERLLRAVADSLSRVSFVYDDGGSFVLEKQQGTWLLEGQQPDSAAVAGFVSALAYLNGAGFDDGHTLDALGNAPFRAVFNEGGKEPVEIKAFRNPAGDGWVLHSSFNPNNLFGDPDGSVFKKVFPGRENLLHGEAKES